MSRVSREKLTTISRNMSRQLRFDLGSFESRRDDGYVRVTELAGNCDTTRDVVFNIYERDAKRRYEWMIDTDGVEWIRATQGQGIDAKELITNTDGMFIPVVLAGDESVTIAADLESSSVSIPPGTRVASHGGSMFNVRSIAKGGLNRGDRMHVHMTLGLPAMGDTGNVSTPISGMRSGCDLVVEVDLVGMIRDGIPVFVSTNRVILSPGEGDTGVIPVRYLTFYFRNTTTGELVPLSLSDKSDSCYPCVFVGFCPKFHNARLVQTLSDKSDDATDGTKRRWAFCHTKESGSLALVRATPNGEYRYNSKNGTNNVYAAVAAWIASVLHGVNPRAFGPEMARAMCTSTYTLSLGFEVVVPRVLGDHGAVPLLPHLVLTSVCCTFRATGETRFYTLLERVKFACNYGLILVESWFVRGNKKIAALQEALSGRNGIRWTGADADVRKELDAMAGSQKITSIVPHDKGQGQVLEGLVVEYVDVEGPGHDSDTLFAVASETSARMAAKWTNPVCSALAQLGSLLAQFGLRMSDLEANAKAVMHRDNPGSALRVSVLADADETRKILSWLATTNPTAPVARMFAHLCRHVVPPDTPDAVDRIDRSIGILRVVDGADRCESVIVHVRRDELFEQYDATIPDDPSLPRPPPLLRGMEVVVASFAPSDETIGNGDHTDDHTEDDDVNEIVPNVMITTCFREKVKCWGYLRGTAIARNLLSVVFASGHDVFMDRVASALTTWGVPQHLHAAELAFWSAWARWVRQFTLVSKLEDASETCIFAGRYLDFYTRFVTEYTNGTLAIPVNVPGSDKIVVFVALFGETMHTFNVITSLIARFRMLGFEIDATWRGAIKKIVPVPGTVYIRTGGIPEKWSVPMFIIDCLYAQGHPLHSPADNLMLDRAFNPKVASLMNTMPAGQIGRASLTISTEDAHSVNIDTIANDVTLFAAKHASVPPFVPVPTVSPMAAPVPVVTRTTRKYLVVPFCIPPGGGKTTFLREIASIDPGKSIVISSDTYGPTSEGKAKFTSALEAALAPNSPWTTVCFDKNVPDVQGYNALVKNVLTGKPHVEIVGVVPAKFGPNEVNICYDRIAKRDPLVPNSLNFATPVPTNGKPPFANIRDFIDRIFYAPATASLPVMASLPGIVTAHHLFDSDQTKMRSLDVQRVVDKISRRVSKITTPRLPSESGESEYSSVQDQAKLINVLQGSYLAIDLHDTRAIIELVAKYGQTVVPDKPLHITLEYYGDSRMPRGFSLEKCTAAAKTLTMFRNDKDGDEWSTFRAITFTPTRLCIATNPTDSSKSLMWVSLAPTAHTLVSVLTIPFHTTITANGVLPSLSRIGETYLCDMKIDPKQSCSIDHIKLPIEFRNAGLVLTVHSFALPRDTPRVVSGHLAVH